MFRLILNDSFLGITVEYDGKSYSQPSGRQYVEVCDIFKKLAMEQQVQKQFIHNGVNQWQFMPSYIFPHIFLTLRVASIANQYGLPISPREFFSEAQRIGSLPKALTAHHLDDLKFIARPLYFQIMRPLVGNKPKQGDVCMVTIPRHFHHGHDLELGAIGDALKEQGQSVFYLDTPYYGNLERRYGFMEILRHKRQRRCHGVFFEDFVTIGSVLGGIRDRLASKAWTPVTLTGYSAFFNACLNRILDYASSVLSPYMASFYLNIAETILDQTRPRKIVLTYETGPYARALILAALKRRIPTVGLVHGHFGLRQPQDYILLEQDPCSTLGSTPPLVTGVYGAYQLDIMTREGSFKPEQIAIVGNWKMPTPKPRRIHSDTDICYPLTVCNSFLEEELFSVVAEGVTKAGINRAEVFFRPHPGHDLHACRILWKNQGFLEENILASPHYSAHEVLSATGICIIDYGSILFESVALGCPVLFRVPTSFPADPLDFPDQNCFVSAGDLAEKIGQAQKRPKEFLFDLSSYHATYGTDSVSKIVELIQNAATRLPPNK